MLVVQGFDVDGVTDEEGVEDDEDDEDVKDDEGVEDDEGVVDEVDDELDGVLDEDELTVGQSVQRYASSQYV